MDQEKAFITINKYKIMGTEKSKHPTPVFKCPPKAVRELKEALDFVYENNAEYYYDRIDIVK